MAFLQHLHFPHRAARDLKINRTRTFRRLHVTAGLLSLQYGDIVFAVIIHNIEYPFFNELRCRLVVRLPAEENACAYCRQKIKGFGSLGKTFLVLNNNTGIMLLPVSTASLKAPSKRLWFGALLRVPFDKCTCAIPASKLLHLAKAVFPGFFIFPVYQHIPAGKSNQTTVPFSSDFAMVLLGRV